MKILCSCGRKIEVDNSALSDIVTCEFCGEKWIFNKVSQSFVKTNEIFQETETKKAGKKVLQGILFVVCLCISWVFYSYMKTNMIDTTTSVSLSLFSFFYLLATSKVE